MTIKRYKPVIREAVDDFDEFEAVMAIDKNQGEWVRYSDTLPMQASNQGLRKEVERLREALKRIETFQHDGNLDDGQVVITLQAIAQDAVNPLMAVLSRTDDSCGGEDGEG